MKRKQLKRIHLTATAILLSLQLFAAPRPPVRTMEIPKACFPPTLDGIAEFFYSEIQTTSIYNPTGYDGDEDYSAQFRICWDASYLYILAEITDDIEHCYQPGIGNPWEFDNIEVFLQLDTNTVTTSYSATTIQLRFTRGLDSVELAGRAAPSEYGIYTASSPTEGWVAELAIPWTAVLPVGAKPEDMEEYLNTVIGFDFAGADSDNTDGDPDVGNRDVQSSWDEDEPFEPNDHGIDPYWNNTSIFGYITLVASDCSLDLKAPSEEILVKPFPNPATDFIILTNITKVSTLTIYNMTGKVVMVCRYHPDQELDISDLSNGLYTINVNGSQSIKFCKMEFGY